MCIPTWFINRHCPKTDVLIKPDGNGIIGKKIKIITGEGSVIIDKVTD